MDGWPLSGDTVFRDGNTSVRILGTDHEFPHLILAHHFFLKKHLGIN